MSNVSARKTVREIASELPGAAEIFRQYGLNFCCGGDIDLETAAVQAGLNIEELISQLVDLEASAKRDAPEVTDALIKYVVNRYHTTHRSELAWLIPLAQKVERVHGDHIRAPRGLSETLVTLQSELAVQMDFEETKLFPVMLHDPDSVSADRLLHSREAGKEIGRHLEAVEHATNGLQLPSGACGSWTALYTGLRKLYDDVVAHHHVESTVLFARFEVSGRAN